MSRSFRRPGARCGCLLATVMALGAMFAMPAPGASAGELAFRGCVSGNGNPNGRPVCAEIPNATSGGYGSALGAVGALAISEDGKSLYASGAGPDCGGGGVDCAGNSALAYFARDPVTGDLTFEGCFTGDTRLTRKGACVAIPGATADGYGSGMGHLESVAVSPDGRSVYTASVGDSAVARFNRDPMTGAITYGGCITGDTRNGPNGTGACAQTRTATRGGLASGLGNIGSVSPSPDGTSVYVAGRSDVAHFERNPTTGALTYASCLTGDTTTGPAGSDACGEIPTATDGGSHSGLDFVDALASSPDGESVYAAGYSEVARFDRNPATGFLDYRGCITGDSSFQVSGGPRVCRSTPNATVGGTRSGLDRIRSLSVTADGKSLYAAASGDDSLARFNRRPSGSIVFQGCATGDKKAGPPGSGACHAIPSATEDGKFSGMDALNAVAASDDGKSVFVGSRGDDAVADFKRDPKTGELRYKGCVADSGGRSSGACRVVPGPNSRTGLVLYQPRGLATSGTSVYAAALGAKNIVHLALAPKTKVTGGPKGSTTTRRAVLRFRASGKAKFECKLKGRHVKSKLRHWRRCGSHGLKHRGKERYRDLASGKKVFKVRATDRATTTDPTPAKRRWRIR